MLCSDSGLKMLGFGFCIVMFFGILLPGWLCCLMLGMELSWELGVVMEIGFVLILRC